MSDRNLPHILTRVQSNTSVPAGFCSQGSVLRPSYLQAALTPELFRWCKEDGSYHCARVLLPLQRPIRRVRRFFGAQQSSWLSEKTVKPAGQGGWLHSMSRWCLTLLTSSLLCVGSCGVLGYSAAAQAAAHAPLPQVLSSPKHVNITALDQSANFNEMRVVSSKANALIYWKDFNVEAGNRVYFSHEKQKPVSFLNVVKGPYMSRIDGIVAAEHSGVNFYLLNPHGITVGPTGQIYNMNSVYLGTAKPKQELLDQFSNADQPALSLQNINPNLNLERGMGRVALLGSVQASDLVLNGSQLVIGNINSVFSINPNEAGAGGEDIGTEGDLPDDDNSHKSVGLPNTFELHSSTNRIDIGGSLDAAITGDDNSRTFCEYLKTKGYSGVDPEDVPVGGTLNTNEYVDHSEQIAILSSDDFKETFGYNVDLDSELQVDKDELASKVVNFGKDFWLADDIVLGSDFTPAGQGLEQNGTDVAFKGSLDGAFHSVSYEGVLATDEDEGIKGHNYGLFAQLDGAEISDLKLVDSSWDLTNADRMLRNSANQDLNLGGLAGVMTDATISNVVVDNFELTSLDNLPRKGFHNIGALAAVASGDNALHHVQTSLHLSDSESLSWVNEHKDHTSVGSMLGKQDGSLDLSGIILSTDLAYGYDDNWNVVSKDNILAGIGSASDDVISHDFTDAYKQALESGSSKDELDAIYVFDGSYGDAGFAYQQRGFLRPFFVEDFIYTYDGKEHDYQELVENDAFVLENFFDLSEDSPAYKQTDAGEYGFMWSTSRDSRKDPYLVGHDFYFDYGDSTKNSTWENRTESAERANRPQSLTGGGALLIKPKKLSLEIKDQIIDYGDELDLEVNEDTLANYDEVIDRLADGDDLDDLGLKLEPDGSTLTVVNKDPLKPNSNYQIEVKEGSWGVHWKELTPAEKPDVDPTPDPDPKPDPDPTPDPDPIPDPDPEPIPDPSPDPIPEPEPEISSEPQVPVVPELPEVPEVPEDLPDTDTVQHASVEPQDTNFSDLDVWNYGSMSILSEVYPVLLSELDYGPYITMALSRGVALQDLPDYLPVGYSSEMLAMNSTQDESKAEGLESRERNEEQSIADALYVPHVIAMRSNGQGSVFDYQRSSVLEPQRQNEIQVALRERQLQSEDTLGFGANAVLAQSHTAELESSAATEPSVVVPDETVIQSESELAAANIADAEDDALPHLAQVQAHDSHEQQEAVERNIAEHTALTAQITAKADMAEQKRLLEPVTKSTVTAQTEDLAKPRNVTAQGVTQSAPVRTAALGKKQEGVRLAS